MALIVDGCCCMNLRTAGFFLAWMGSGTSILAFILRIYFVFEQSYNETEIPLYVTIFILMAFLAFQLFLCGLLVKGILTNKHQYLLPALAFLGIGLTIIILGGFMLFSMGFFSITKRPDLIGMGVLLLIPISLGCWVWIVIYSLYEEIRLSTKNEMLVESQVKNGQMEKHHQVIN